MKLLVLFSIGSFLCFFDLFVFFIFCGIFVLVLVFDYSFFFFGGIFFCDSLSFFLIFLTVFVFLFVFFSFVGESKITGGGNLPLFFLFFIFFLLLVCFSSFSVFLFYLCFELIFMAMFVYIMGWGGSPERTQASFYMVFYTIVVSFPFLIYLVYVEFFSFSLKFLFFFDLSSYFWCFIVFVFLVKLPVYGVHLWLPKAHVEAPVGGSMLLAGVLLKLGGYGVLRLSFNFPGLLSSFGGYLMSAGLVGGFISCFLCVRQSDLKAFVAYSSVCHMGFSLAGLYSFSLVGMKGSVYMFVAHGFCSSCLFYILYIFYERFHSRSLFLIKGVGVLSPLILLVWFLFSVLNMGVPPFFPFFSEVCLIIGLVEMSFYLTIMLGPFLFWAGVYGIFLYIVSCHGLPVISGISRNITVREYLNLYGHFFPLGFVPFFLGVFF